MSEIEKMYRKIGLASHSCKYPRFCDDNNCNECPNYSSEFTAEKQLKILCFIVNKKHSVTFHDQVFGCDKLTLEKIQENLAWAINRIWQNLTESEQEQIRSILNGN